MDNKGRVIDTLEYCIGVDWNIRHVQIQWCNNTFKDVASWWYYAPQGVIYFKKECDLNWFKMRWA